MKRSFENLPQSPKQFRITVFDHIPHYGPAVPIVVPKTWDQVTK